MDSKVERHMPRYQKKDGRRSVGNRHRVIYAPGAADEYFNLPLNLDAAVHKKELAKCTLYDSVTNMVHLIAIIV